MLSLSKVLSLSPDTAKLALRESAIRKLGLEVKSVDNPGQARFEIERGIFQVFVSSRLVSDIVNQDLMRLFRQRGEAGVLIIFVDSEIVAGRAPFLSEVDFVLTAADDPQGIVEALESRVQGSIKKTAVPQE